MKPILSSGSDGPTEPRATTALPYSERRDCQCSRRHTFPADGVQRHRFCDRTDFLIKTRSCFVKDYVSKRSGTYWHQFLLMIFTACLIVNVLTCTQADDSFVASTHDTIGSEGHFSQQLGTGGPTLPRTYEVVYPYISDGRGHFLAAVGHEEEKKRRKKRSELANKNRLYIVVEHQNEKFVMKLHRNRKLVIQDAQVEWLLDSKHRERDEVISADCYYIGRLRRHKHSVVAVNVCDGLEGFIKAKSGNYFIQRLPSPPTNGSLWPHVLYPADESIIGDSISLADDQWFFNDDDDDTRTRRKRDVVVSNDVHEVTTKAKEKTMEVTVAADHSVVGFHGDKIEQFILVLLNIVSAIYADPSLGANITIVIVRILLLKSPKESKIHEGNSRLSLETVCNWMNQIANEEPKIRHDIGIFLTRLNIGGPAGYAPVGGMCNPRRSCSLNRDEGLTSAFIIAHEIGHVLGLSHDGDEDEGNTCTKDGNEGSIMAPLVMATFTRFHWSECSKKEYNNKINGWFCLNNKPTSTPTWPSLSPPLGRSYSLDDQCRMEFGDGFQLCRSFLLSDPCTHLWCSNKSVPLLCKTKKGPPLEGTPCGTGKWCAKGFCQQINKKKILQDPVHHNPRHGGWSEWSSYGDCSRSCGGGIRFRTRKCDHPKPAFGGKQCSGEREEFIICNKQLCPHVKDFRAEQCSHLHRIVKMEQPRSKQTWRPYPVSNENSFCRLVCISKQTKEVLVAPENVIDGTPCNYDNPNNICVQGHCQMAGCDKVLGSNKTEDSCGICGGNGSHCRNVQKVYVRSPTKPYSRVAIIPKGAREMVVKQISKTANYLALQSRRTGEIVLNGNNSEATPSFVTEGARFEYSRMDEYETLRSKGPLLDEVIIMIHPVIPGTPIMITVNYTVAMRRELDSVTANEDIYVWEITGWSRCSRTCGGGEQFTKMACRDRRTDGIVSKRHCSLLDKPDMRRRVCNPFSCTYRWRAEPWESCTHSCGSSGVQHRLINCVPVNETRTIVEPEWCRDGKPEESRPCNRITCPNEWILGNWSECSVTCGQGIQMRQVKCVPPENEILYDCGEKPEAVKECFQEPCISDICQGDASEFCQLSVLRRYCQIPSYKTMCCETCSNHVPETVK